jgi:hypothetical protein
MNKWIHSKNLYKLRSLRSQVNSKGQVQKGKKVQKDMSCYFLLKKYTKRKKIR